MKKSGLSRFCGKHQDERDAEDIVADIYSERKKNCFLRTRQDNKAAEMTEIEKEIDIGIKSPISPRSHEEIFDNIREKYVSR